MILRGVVKLSFRPEICERSCIAYRSILSAYCRRLNLLDTPLNEIYSSKLLLGFNTNGDTYFGDYCGLMFSLLPTFLNNSALKNKLLIASATSCLINWNLEGSLRLDYSLSLVESYYLDEASFRDFISANRKGVQGTFFWRWLEQSTQSLATFFCYLFSSTEAYVLRYCLFTRFMTVDII